MSYSSIEEFSWRREPDTSRKIVTDPLAVIYNEGLWKVYKVSPLYSLQYDPVKLKQYASKIRQAIVSSVQATSLTYTVTCEVPPVLKYTEDDPDGLQITIYSAQNNTQKPKMTYMALLLSWGECVQMENAIHLPYMLDRGEKRLSTAVKATLQTMFDCNIKQFLFGQQQVLQLGFSFLEKDTSRSDESFTLVYRNPQAEGKEKFSLSFCIEDIRVIWHGIKKESDNLFQLLTVAYQMLQEQIFTMTMFNVNALELCEILLPKAEVKNTGMLKMKTPEMVNCVFTVLNDINNVLPTRTELEDLISDSELSF